jgi:hypothetical protein
MTMVDLPVTGTAATLHTLHVSLCSGSASCSFDTGVQIVSSTCTACVAQLTCTLHERMQ